MKKERKEWRTIVVDGATYYWRVGKSLVQIRDEDFRGLIRQSAAAIKGISEYTFERGSHKKTHDGMLRPAEIERCIRAFNMKRQVAEYYDARPKRKLFPSDVARALHLDAYSVFQITQALTAEGKLT